MESKYISQWRNLMIQASEALAKKNFSEYENLMMQVNNAYDNFKRDSSLYYECTNFGMANYIFEDVLPSVFVSKPSLMKEWMNIIKEDVNLLSQFQFYKALENCSSSNDIKEYVNESLDLVRSGINVKTLSKSNNKLNQFLKEHDIKPSSHIPQDMLNLFESCDFLFKNKKKLNNLNVITEHLAVVSDYTSKVIKESVNNNTISSLLEKVEASSNLLNEEEQNLVMSILDCKAKDGEQKKRKLYDKFKTECIKSIDKLLENAEHDDSEGLKNIKEQLIKQEFCSETLVADIAKLLEIRDILMSE